MKTMPTQLLQTQVELDRWVDKHLDHSWVALDLEANSLHVYPEQLCLIQVRSASGSAIIDALCDLNLEPVAKLLQQNTLVLHGGDYDLRLLYRHYHFLAEDIFDTMLAARLCGLQRFSLADLVWQFFKITLDKSLQKVDWSIRPLTSKMIHYADSDTQFLLPLAEILSTRLKELDRAHWHREWCQRLVAITREPSTDDPQNCWRIRGSGHLSRLQLAILREAWKWREKRALERKRPPYFIVSHENLIELCISLSKALGKKERTMPHFPRSIPERWHAEILQAIDKVRTLPPEEWPLRQSSKPIPKSDEEQKRLQRLLKTRDDQATRLGIEPTLIAGKALLGRLAQDWDRSFPLLMTWQKELLSLQSQDTTKTG